MSLVNIIPILTVLSMTKIIYSQKFMMEKVFNVNNLLFKKRWILKQTKQVSQQSSKLSDFLNAHVLVAFKIIVKLNYLKR